MRNHRLLASVILSLVICGHSSTQAQKRDGEPGKADECNLPQNVVDDIASYANVTNQIIDYFTKGPYKGQTWNLLAKFVDMFGHRLSGSQALEDAIDYMVAESKINGLNDVHTEDVQVPHWVRGKESATLIEPRLKNLPILGLGSSVGTPPEGITAQVIVVQSFDELNALSNDEVTGKIVVYAAQFVDYGTTVPYRGNGASAAARKGAVAALVRSITPFSLATPHTGSQTYAENVNKIPVAAITLEDADQMLRLQNEGVNVTINLIMSATSDTKVSRNTIIDLKGSSLPEQVVVISGHLDSWDVGDGAMDDGGGSFISWVAPVVLKKLNLQPQRTLRTILWTAEEQGIIGAIAYEKEHRADNDKLNFVMESDGGTFSPRGLVYSGSKTGECMMREILKLFSEINTTEMELAGPGPDISVWTDIGVPGGGLYNANDKYFWYHHSAGDTVNVEEPDVLDRCAAFWTAFSYIVADMAADVPRI